MIVFILYFKPRDKVATVQYKSKSTFFVQIFTIKIDIPERCTDETRVAYVLKTTPSLKSAGRPRTLQEIISQN